MKDLEIATGSSASPEKKSALERLLQIVVRELMNLMLTWVLKKFPGAPASSPGASEKQDFLRQELPGAQDSSPQEN